MKKEQIAANEHFLLKFYICENAKSKTKKYESKGGSKQKQTKTNTEEREREIPGREDFIVKDNHFRPEFALFGFR